MKRNSFIVLCFFFPIIGFCQDASSKYFYRPKAGDKYFVALGYGVGTAHWNSVFKSTEFYDKDGSVISDDGLKFSSNSPTKHYDVNVLAPVKHVRLGLGIAFEHHYLAQLKIYTKDGESYLLFDEGLRFDKMYLQMEVPFKYDSKKKYTISWNLRAGWFGYTNIKRFNFTGEKPFAISILGATGVTADYELYPHLYVYVFPDFEFKYYDNARTENPVQIRHNVWGMSMIGGLRVDLGRFYN